jgi:hypothetical protein
MIYPKITISCDESERAYLAALDNRLSTLASRSGATLESVIRGARGAFPTLVLQRLRALGLDRNLPEKKGVNTTSEASFSGPELHPLDFEWYFTQRCANDLAEILSNHAGIVLCLGAPTVAVAIAFQGQRAILVDSNPLIIDRLPKGQAGLQFVLFDLFNPLPLRASFPVVFFDAPWYPEFTSLWLWQASQTVRPGGLIAFALFPPLLRPEAQHDCSQILKQASILGPVKLLEGVLSYETPLFEQEALARCGVRIKTSWRRADLVLVRARKIPQTNPPIIHNSKEKWDSFLLGQQVVKLRMPTRGESGFILAPLEDYPDYVFPSVSRRDPSRDQIDLWTSRNRVARVGRRDIVYTILNHLAKGLDLDKLLELPALSSVSPKNRRQLISSLRLILKFPGGREDGCHVK